MITKTFLLGALALLAGNAALADPCATTIEADDRMQFNTRELLVPADCPTFDVTLRHSGKLAMNIMGHDWVLAKSSDVSAILNAAMAAGTAHGYLPTGDKRIIAATKLIGGGEVAVAHLDVSALSSSENYTFFCTTPGHATVMRGKFRIGKVTTAG
ncbi:MAG: azurin [Proteobacteria bacterium]|nr:azurin [Pseudomonadota bacterium]